MFYTTARRACEKPRWNFLLANCNPVKQGRIVQPAGAPTEGRFCGVLSASIPDRLREVLDVVVNAGHISDSFITLSIPEDTQRLDNGTLLTALPLPDKMEASIRYHYGGEIVPVRPVRASPKDPQFRQNWVHAFSNAHRPSLWVRSNRLKASKKLDCVSNYTHNKDKVKDHVSVFILFTRSSGKATMIIK
ncbi:hypothetical protein K503DRAFT_783164 [Rhizopogon vinicolor AM-OR11-026]|uniref:Uncharacterized protein n=1 Tax=Rhizopogon vinicolor AM-OR11-026 TaxID=1314800 RepID=A0A1B7MZQ8_9AGAM|nr:hypothetical protein K503DRAFT_783164 [Rhizopogon vinicolor AM-OR11-026]